ncbi:unnamed protein product [Lepeophtheirus salmonis]|uniref:(salmon louse) hypothetical protein n=1 Tax=Lepeophtheirus salmonis TaxID=72036 RepID=A0A7R8CIG3_LEPSM|nr:unnamed protein product [Lepeophtheirus salmonis]CAF2795322.1 unnamed protein product [Lepeophtheirus salmonis]
MNINENVKTKYVDGGDVVKNARRRVWSDAFPKSNYNPSKNSVLCEKHFTDDDFETMRKDSKESRRKQRGPLKNKKLKVGAVPSIWDESLVKQSVSPIFMNFVDVNTGTMEDSKSKSLIHFPFQHQQMSSGKGSSPKTKLIFPTSTQRPPRKILPKPPIVSSSLEVNHKTNIEGDHCYTALTVNMDEDHCYAFHNIKKEKWEEGDEIVSMYDFEYKIEKAQLPSGVKIFRKDSKYYFYLPNFQEDGNAKIGFSLELLDNFKYNAFVNGIKILRDDIKLSFNAKITKISELILLLEYLKSKSEGMPNSSFLICQAKKNLEKCIEISDEGHSSLISKLLFLKEQCDLLLSKSHKYSDSLLSVALMWHQQAPTLYEQIRKDGVMTLPSASHLRRFTSFNAESGLPSNTVSYLRSRFDNLTDVEKVIAIVFDEFYVVRKFEFSRGRLQGKNNENIPKSSFSLMIKSIAGSYRDIVYTSSKSSIKAQTIYDVYMAALKALTDIGFRVVAVISDGNSSHIHFFKDKIFNGSLLPIVENPFDPAIKIHIIFEQSTILKNFYHSFLSKKFYNKSVKISHYLEDKCLSPSPVEKSNFRLGCAIFHESTIKSLECHTTLEHDFSETISFARVIFNWWDLCNLKTIYSFLVAKNTVAEKEWFDYMDKFSTWLKAWKSNPSINSTLNPDIFESVNHNSQSIPKLAQYLLEFFATEGILFETMVRDSIEDGVTHFSQFSGRNFNASVGQLLGMETKPPETEEPNENLSGMDECVISKIVGRSDQFVSQSVSGDSCLNFYIAGCIARMISRTLKCNSCLELIIFSSFLPIEIIKDDCEMENKETFIDQISNNLINYPTDLFFYTVIIANCLYQTISSDDEINKELKYSPNSETVFSQTFVRSCFDNVNYGLSEQKCTKGHSYRYIAEKVALHIFNIGARNHFEEFFNLIYCQIVRNSVGDEDMEGEEEEDGEESETYIVETIEAE